MLSAEIAFGLARLSGSGDSMFQGRSRGSSTTTAAGIGIARVIMLHAVRRNSVDEEIQGMLSARTGRKMSAERKSSIRSEESASAVISVVLGRFFSSADSHIYA